RLVNHVVMSDRGESLDNRVTSYLGPIADCCVGFNHDKGTDANLVTKSGGRANDSGWMYGHLCHEVFVDHGLAAIYPDSKEFTRRFTRASRCRTTRINARWRNKRARADATQVDESKSLRGSSFLIQLDTELLKLPGEPLLGIESVNVRVRGATV